LEANHVEHQFRMVCFLSVPDFERGATLKVFDYFPTGVDFAPRVGNLFEWQFKLFETEFAKLHRPIRHLKIATPTARPHAHRFTLSVHRDDLDIEQPAIDAVLAVIDRPRGSLVNGMDLRLAAHFRQIHYQRGIDDPLLMQSIWSNLLRELDWLVNRLAGEAEEQFQELVWLDGLISIEEELIEPFGIRAIGYIYTCKGNTQQCQQPFKAEVFSTQAGPAVDRLIVHFGNRKELTEINMLTPDVGNELQADRCPYVVRVGNAVHRKEGVVAWAFEIVKQPAPTASPPPAPSQAVPPPRR